MWWGRKGQDSSVKMDNKYKCTDSLHHFRIYLEICRKNTSQCFGNGFGEIYRNEEACLWKLQETDSKCICLWKEA